MKKKSLMFVVLVLSLTILVVGCGNNDNNSEKEINNVLDILAEGIQEGNEEQLKSIFSESGVLLEDEREDFEDRKFSRKEMVGLMALRANMGEDLTVEIKNRVISDVSDTATVEAKIYIVNEGSDVEREEVDKIKFGLINQEGNWYINSFMNSEDLI